MLWTLNENPYSVCTLRVNSYELDEEGLENIVSLILLLDKWEAELNLQPSVPGLSPLDEQGTVNKNGLL